MEKNKPGFMVYKSTVETLETLTGDQCKTLMLAIGEFAFQETEPDFTDDKLVSLWPLIRDGLVRDDTKYRQKGVGKQYGAYKTAMIRHKLTPMEREEWEALGCPTYLQLLRGEVHPPEAAKQEEAFASDAKQEEATAKHTLPFAKQEEANAKHTLQLPITTTTTSTTTIPPTTSPPPPPTTSEAGAAVAADAPAFAKVVKEIRNLIPQLSPLREETLERYCSQVGADVCVRAIYEARDANVNGAAVWSYIESILKRCEASGIRSLEDWNAAEEERRAKRSGRQKGGTSSGLDRNRIPSPEEYESEDTFHLL